MLIAGYVLSLCFVFFSAFNAQPRLGVVMMTLENCLSDIIHLFVVILPSMFAFTLSGIFIFGRYYESFCQVSTTFFATFRILMEGEWDWEALSDQAFFLSMFWIFSLIVMMVMVL